MREGLLRVPEVAELLGVGRTTVYHLIKCGQIKSVQVAGCRRVASQDVIGYIELLRGGMS